MKIAYVTQRTDTFQEKHSLDISILRSEGYEVIVVYCGWYTYEGVTTKGALGKGWHVTYRNFTFEKAVSEINEFHPDLVIFNFGEPWVTMGLTKDKNLNIPPKRLIDTRSYGPKDDINPCFWQIGTQCFGDGIWDPEVGAIRLRNSIRKIIEFFKKHNNNPPDELCNTGNL